MQLVTWASSQLTKSIIFQRGRWLTLHNPHRTTLALETFKNVTPFHSPKNFRFNGGLSLLGVLSGTFRFSDRGHHQNPQMVARDTANIRTDRNNRHKPATSVVNQGWFSGFAYIVNSRARLSCRTHLPQSVVQTIPGKSTT